MVEAIQYTAETCITIDAWVFPDEEEIEHDGCGILDYYLADEETYLEPGDWLVRDNGKLYPVKPDIFLATYEAV